MVAAFAKWIYHAGSPAAADASQDRHQDPAPKWPADSNADLCDLFFGTMERHHEELMGDRPHYCMFSVIIQDDSARAGIMPFGKVAEPN